MNANNTPNYTRNLIDVLNDLDASPEVIANLEQYHDSQVYITRMGDFEVSRDNVLETGLTFKIVDINGVDVDTPIYKDPKTDQSKKSARGLLQVIGDPITGEVLGYKDMQTREEELQGLLEVVLKDSVFADGSLKTMFQIRDVLWG